MFDIIPKALSSVASFLFPLFASYKALKTADPAQLTPWLMYWVVLACALLVESWTDWILTWVPFYAWFRLFFLLYLVLPQTQGARILYQTRLHPFLAENESHIDEFIGSAHEKLKAAGLAYLQQALAYARKALGLAAVEPEAPAPASTTPATAQSYTQALLARFTLPSARWPEGSSGSSGSGGGSGSGGIDYYSLFTSAVGAVGALGSSSSSSSQAATGGSADRASSIASQRDRLRSLLSALDREAAQLAAAAATSSDTEKLGYNHNRATSGSHTNSSSPKSRRASGASGLSKSRSEADFEKIDAESGAEGDDDGGHARRRTAADGSRASSGSWMPWSWNGSPQEGEGTSSGVEK